mgnify:FL=1
MYGTGARLFHWSIAAFVAVQIPAGVAMTSEPLRAWADPLFILHKGLGSVLLVLVVGRIAWRVTHPPPPMPEGIPEPERRMARATHLTLYALLLLMATSGYVRTVADGYPVELLGALWVPPLLPRMPGLAAASLVVHQFAVFALVVLAAVHVGAVIQRDRIDGLPILERMWPPIAPGGEADGRDG